MTKRPLMIYIQEMFFLWKFISENFAETMNEAKLETTWWQIIINC